MPCFYGFEIGVILCVIDWCLNNMLLCEKIMLIYVLLMDVNYMYKI